MSTRSLAGAIVVVLAAVAVFAIPVAAAPRTWYVARTGSGGGSCAHPNKHTIQSAITAAGPGDTILVCDGTYTEILAIQGPAKDRLKVRAVHPGKAVVRAPASGNFMGFISFLVRIQNADNTRFSGFTLSARGRTPCLPVAVMIQITGSSTATTLAQNRIIVGDGTHDYEHPCGYAAGIAHDPGAPTAFINGNRIVDYGGTGILSNGPNTRITNNVLTLGHTAHPLGGTQGIAVTGAPNLVVQGNDVEGPATAGTGTPVLAAGIYVTKATGAIVSGNTVRHAYNGIEVGAWVGGRIRGNTVRNSAHNGVWVDDSKGVKVLSNSSLGSGNLDCYERAGGNNTWTGNTGNTSKPAGLCSPP